MKPKGHSPFGGSKAPRYMHCAGSIAMCAEIPDDDPTYYAIEGTIAHGVAESMLKGVPNEKLIGQKRVLNGTVVEVTEEMVDHCSVYVDEVIRYAGNDGAVMVEHEFHLTDIDERLWGSADAAVLKRHNKRLGVFDLKFGQGVAVEPDSEQLMFYGLGVLLEAKIPVDTIDLVIVQPRCAHVDGPIRTHTISAMDLLEFGADLQAAVNLADDPSAPLVPGDWCRWCSAQGACPALQARAQELAKQEFSDASVTTLLGKEQLAETLAQLPMIESWIKRTREFAYSMALHGETVPGWKLVEKRARARFKDDNAAIFELDILGLSEEEMYESKLLSPAKARALLKKKGVDESKLDDLIVKESSGLALVPADDKRPEYHRPTPQDDFKTE